MSIEIDIVACKIATKECRCDYTFTEGKCLTTDCGWWRMAHSCVLRTLEIGHHVVIHGRFYDQQGNVMPVSVGSG